MQESKEMRRAYNKAWAEKNKDKIRAATKLRIESGKNKESAKTAYAKNRDQILAAKKEYYEKNKELIKEKVRARRAANPEKIRKMELGYREQDREGRSARQMRYAKENSEKILARNRNRRAKQKNAEGSHTASDVADIRKYQKNRCAYCSSKLGKGAHLDHIIPLARGGSNWPSNLQWLCQPCNNRKSAKDPIMFARENGLLL